MSRTPPRARTAPQARTSPVAHKVRGGQGVSGKNATGIGRRVPRVTAVAGAYSSAFSSAYDGGG